MSTSVSLSAESREARDAVRRALEGTHQLIFFRRAMAEEPGSSFVKLLEAVLEGGIQEASKAYHAFVARLWQWAAQRKAPLAGLGAGNLWQQYLIDCVLNDENPFTLQCEAGGLEALGTAMREAARHDLLILGRLCHLQPDLVKQLMSTGLAAEGRDFFRGDDPLAWPGWGDSASSDGEGQSGLPGGQGPDAPLAGLLLAAADWPTLLERLAAHYRKHGVGVVGRFHVLRWVRDGAQGRLEGVENPDPIRLSDLVGYEEIREPVYRNTLKFVRGMRANNVLLYGDRGTGKSATVKALVNEWAAEGLRLVEVPRRYFEDLPHILKVLRRRPQRFILFIDDLSFEEQETAYKDLKALLEGSVEIRPDNVVIYATSNRRHLVRERFSDRDGAGDGDLRRHDTVQEKLSLADRFGLTVVFPSPDQEKYLQIVEALARQEGIDIPQARLYQEALRWALWNNDRSARTARQFVDDLKGELALAR